MHEYPEYPRPAVAVVVFKQERILVVKRRNPPAAGTWSVPGGSIRRGETMADAVERETFEETGITVRTINPFTAIDVIRRDDGGGIRFHYVIVYFLAEYLSGEPVPGDDASEAGWFTLDELSGMNRPAGTMELIRQALESKRSNNPQ